MRMRRERALEIAAKLPLADLLSSDLGGFVGSLTGDPACRCHGGSAHQTASSQGAERLIAENARLRRAISDLALEKFGR